MTAIADAAVPGTVHMDHISGASEVPATDEPYVFVSYARADEKQAKAVIKCIDRAGFRVWWDALIPSGDRFSARIAEALEGARAIVVLWSVHSIDSVWVQDEAGWGRDHHRLIPISIDGSAPPLGFRQLQCVNLAKGGLRTTNPEMQRALRAIAEMLDQPHPEFPRAPLVDRRTALIGGSVAAVAAAGFGVWRYLGSTSAANSLAVLPFQNLSGDASKQYLSDGLSAELRATLGTQPLVEGGRPGFVEQVPKLDRRQSRNCEGAGRGQPARWQCPCRREQDPHCRRACRGKDGLQPVVGEIRAAAWRIS